MTKTHERTPARKNAVQVLYSSGIRHVPALELLQEGSLECLERPLTDYGYKLIQGVEENKEDIDERIANNSENWSIDRMPILDLSILRIALFEMMYIPDVPISVSINEAVQLAKSFGGEEDSPKFINGILGNIARQLEGSDNDENESES